MTTSIANLTQLNSWDGTTNATLTANITVSSGTWPKNLHII